MDKDNLQKISIDELQQDNPSLKKKEVAENNDYANSIMAGLDKVIERTKNDALNFQTAKEDAEFEGDQDIKNFQPINPLNTILDEDDDKNTTDAKAETPQPDIAQDKPAVKQEVNIPEPAEGASDPIVPGSIPIKVDKEEEPVKEEAEESIFDSDMDDESDSETDEEEENEKLKVLQQSLKEKIKPITNAIDLKSFTVSKHAVSTSIALNAVNTIHKIDWMLYATGIPITLTDFSADEIERLDPRTSSENSFNTMTSIYKLIYDHIVFRSGYKPTFEQWIRTIKYYDTDDIYFAVLLASFDKKLTMPFQCKKCNNVYLKEINTKDLIKYKNKAVEQRVQDIISTNVFSPASYNTERVQISDNLVMDLKEPTIFDTVFANARLDKAFTKKYNRVIGAIPYIDNMYIINREKMSLDPIDIKSEKDDLVKSYKAKVRKFGAMIASLNSDQYYLFNSYITKISERYSDNIVYGLPESTCTHCGHTNEAVADTGAALLFTRHRLMNLIAIPTN